jgi:hypothetical protein
VAGHSHNTYAESAVRSRKCLPTTSEAAIIGAPIQPEKRSKSVIIGAVEGNNHEISQGNH